MKEPILTSWLVTVRADVATLVTLSVKASCIEQAIGRAIKLAEVQWGIIEPRVVAVREDTVPF